MKTIFTVVGARPQFIKAAVLSRQIRESEQFTEILVHTGQHYDKNMSDVFFTELGLQTPDYNLNIGSGSHGQMTGRQLEKIEELLLSHKPDYVCVYGDTNSTLAGALAAVKLHIPIIHIEAGLRSYNRQMPEEINRILVDHISSFLFAPNDTAVSNLISEGIDKSKIFQSGDIMYDAVLYYSSHANKPASLSALSGIDEFVLATIHRAENTDSRDDLAEVFKGLSASNRPVVLPIHPRARLRLSEFGIDIATNIHLIDPVSYLEMMWLEKHANMIITDSGGVQKEAYFHRTPCLTMRDETEWTSLCEAGWNKIVGRTSESIAAHINQEIDCETLPLVDFGNGNVSEIVLGNLS